MEQTNSKCPLDESRCWAIDCSCKMEQTKANTAEEILSSRYDAAEAIISKEADKCAEETKTRTRWNDQLIEVQYMIMGSMIDFSDQENKQLQSYIANLEAEKANYKKQLNEFQSKLSDERRLKDKAKKQLSELEDKHALYKTEFARSTINLEAQNKELIDKYAVLVQDYSDKFYEQAKEIKELREALEKIKTLAQSKRGAVIPDEITSIAKQALKKDKQDG